MKTTPLTQAPNSVDIHATVSSRVPVLTMTQAVQGEMEGCKISITPEARTTRQRASSLQLEWKRVVQATVHVYGGSTVTSPERPMRPDQQNNKVAAYFRVCM